MELWRKGATREVAITVGEVPEDRIAQNSRGQSKPPASRTANRLGLVVSDLSAEQRKDNKPGVVVDEIRGQAPSELRAGDVITALTIKGQTTEIRSAEQFNKLAASLDRSVPSTLHVRRGERNFFVILRGESGAKGG